MKILHIADLHLGKKIAGYSLIDDQRYFLDKTIQYMNDNDINHLIIAGDIYDVASPSGEAIELFSNFLVELKKNKIKAFIISGNHDSSERVGYGSSLFKNSDIYINSNIKEAINPICVDGVNYYLIPYASAAEINQAFDQDFKTYDDAFRYLVSLIKLDENKINIAVAHQLVLNGDGTNILGGSEEPIIGTIQNLSADIFNKFSYVALGHIHKPQQINEKIRYCGSPLAYHVDESKYAKTYTIINISDNNIEISLDNIKPLRDVIEIKDTFDNIINNYEEYRNYYVYAIIIGNEVENAMAKLKNKYPYAMSLRYLKEEAKDFDITKKISDFESVSNEDLFAKLYLEQKGKELSDFQLKLIKKIFGECEKNEAN